jgi:hypothetical protein
MSMFLLILQQMDNLGYINQLRTFIFVYKNRSINFLQLFFKNKMLEQIYLILNSKRNIT